MRIIKEIAVRRVAPLRFLAQPRPSSTMRILYYIVTAAMFRYTIIERCWKRYTLKITVQRSDIKLLINANMKK